MAIENTETETVFALILPDDAPLVDALAPTDKLLIFRDGNIIATTTVEKFLANHATTAQLTEATNFTFRNLCLNSRGDNLNCWMTDTGATVSIDAEMFGYPVIKASGYSYMYPTGVGGVDNWREISGLNTSTGGTGLDKDIVFAYDIYPLEDMDIRAGEDIVGNINTVHITANQWNRAVFKIPAGATLDILACGLPLGAITTPSLGCYYQNIQIEYGTEATPYTYNPTLSHSLTEQIVPGEFWLGVDGVSRQVYQRTFAGVLSPIYQGHSRTTLISGGVYQANIYGQLSVMTTEGDDNTCSESFIQIHSIGNCDLINFQPLSLNQQYSLTIKYTKR